MSLRPIKILVGKLKECADCRRRREALEREYYRIKAKVDSLAKRLEADTKEEDKDGKE